MNNTLTRGRAGGFGAAFGAATGNTTQALVAGLGVAVIFTRYPAAATVLRFGGAAFLIWLGAKALFKRATPATPATTPTEPTYPRVHHTTAYREGLTVNLLNPAITSFYMVVLPSFMPRGAGPGYFAMLAAAHIVLAFVCHTFWTLAFDFMRDHLTRPRVARALNIATGLVLIGLGVKAAVR